MNPAQYIIFFFGGVRATARAVGCTPSAVSKWTKPKSEHGSGGQIPAGSREIIIALAKAHRLDITANDLVYGRKVKYYKKESGK